MGHGLLQPTPDVGQRRRLSSRLVAPSQLYEAALEGVLLFLLLRLATHRTACLSRRGAIAGLFLVLYGLFRIALENVRNPDLTMPTFPLGLTIGMMLSTPLVALGARLLWRAFRPNRH